MMTGSCHFEWRSSSCLQSDQTALQICPVIEQSECNVMLKFAWSGTIDVHVGRMIWQGHNALVSFYVGAQSFRRMLVVL